MFEEFATEDVPGEGATIRLRRAGKGPPLLLLHGYPQTHAMWHRIAPGLARDFTVIAADLRGYGDSAKPPSDATHAAYGKRAMALDMVRVMERLGFLRFFVAGHDRGGRVAHRMALDHAERVLKVAVLDIVPTLAVFERINQAVATGYYHWFFLSQPFDLPEHLIGADPGYYLKRKIGQWSANKQAFAPEALAEYLRCFSDPAAIHASCEDYRAAASIDLEHDRADLARKVSCPLLALWGAQGLPGRSTDVLALWRERAADVRGFALPCGHFLAEEAPQATEDALSAFFLEENGGKR